MSVSNYICTPHATGAMAAVFFFPCIHAWQNAMQLEEEDFRVKAALILFQAGFGCFLSCPDIYVPHTHVFFVLSFSISGLVYCGLMRKHCRQREKPVCNVLFGVALSAFAALPPIGTIGALNHDFLVTHAPWAFYVGECTGLTAMVLFAFVWQRS